MEWIEIISNLGVPIGGLCACAIFISNNVTRDRDESKEREKILRDESKEREDRLIEANKQLSEALTKVAETIETTNELNRVLSENNKIFTEQLDEMNDGITKILNKLD